jgi:hypothetical protein
MTFRADARLPGKGAFRFPSREVKVGRDIALPCPRPRSSGRKRCAAAPGAESESLLQSKLPRFEY